MKHSKQADSRAERKLIKNEVNKMKEEEFIEKMLSRFDCIKSIKTYVMGEFLILFKPDNVPAEIEDIESVVKEYGYVANFAVYQLKNTEVLDRILHSDDFEDTLIELMDFQPQKYYKINLTNYGLDIDIFDITIDSQLFKSLKKKGLIFKSYGKNTLNIREENKWNLLNKLL